MGATSVVQTRGLRDDLKVRGIEWREPKRHRTFHPEISGDLQSFNAPDPSRPAPKMTYAIEEYDEYVTNLFNLTVYKLCHPVFAYNLYQ